MENRIPGADCNPYLAFAATIAAGLHGIEHGIDPPERFDGNAYEAHELPRVPPASSTPSPRWSRARPRSTRSASRCTAPVNTARQEWLAFGTVSPTGNGAALRAVLTE